jgi:hypothetical protein
LDAATKRELELKLKAEEGLYGDLMRLEIEENMDEG